MIISTSEDAASKLRKFSLLTLTFAVVLFAPGIAAAQDGAVSGTVRDEAGLVLQGVTAEAREVDAEDGQTTATDNLGQFTISGLASGTYELTFALPGFNAPSQMLEVSADATATVDVTMEVILLEPVVVVGTRAQPRSVTESSVPVDIIAAGDLAAQGTSDLRDQMRSMIPSYNVATHAISDAATFVRPANMRGLPPDHTLVLVNNKRRHRSSVITLWAAGLGDGAQGPDISVIPAIAIRQVEVLRDGAAAQYGSDAIGGVMNFQLKDAREGSSVQFRYGSHLDENPGDTATCGEGVAGDIQHSCNGIGGRGPAFTVAGNTGLPLGNNGFLNLSLEYGGADPTSRSVQR